MFVRFAFDECFASRCFNQAILRQNFQVQRAREIHICVVVPFSFFSPTISNRRDFSIELERCLLPVFAQLFRRHERRSEEEKVGTSSAPVRFLVLSRSPQPTLPRLIPVPLSRGNTKQGTCS